MSRLLISLVWVFLFGSSARAESLDRLQATIASITADLQVRVLRSPSSGLVLGGLILPGHEDIPALYAAELIDITASTVQSRETVLPALVPIGPLESLLKDLPAPQTGSLQGTCAAAPAFVDRLMLDELRPRRQRAPNEPSPFGLFISREGLSQKDVEGYVVITRIVRASLTSPGCSGQPEFERLQDWFSKLSWGYSGGVPVDTFGVAGSRGILSVLQAFELDKIAVDRSLEIGGIDSQPTGVDVGWIGRVKLGRRDPKAVPDGEFSWLGSTPIGKYLIWPGRFFFRLKGRSETTVQRDLSLSDAGSVIRLRLEP